MKLFRYFRMLKQVVRCGRIRSGRRDRRLDVGDWLLESGDWMLEIGNRMSAPVGRFRLLVGEPCFGILTANLRFLVSNFRPSALQ
jgi:hypothetical protein